MSAEILMHTYQPGDGLMERGAWLDEQAAVLQSETATIDEKNLAMAAIMNCLEPTLDYVVSRIIQSEEERKDIVRDTFAQGAWQDVGNYQPRGQFSGWLVRISHNKALNADKRKEHRVTKPIGGSVDFEMLEWKGKVSPRNDPADIYEQTEESREIAELLNYIPDRYREAVKLRLAGYSHKEITKLLELNPGTTLSRIGRGYKFLRDFVELIEAEQN